MNMRCFLSYGIWQRFVVQLSRLKSKWVLVVLQSIKIIFRIKYGATIKELGCCRKSNCHVTRCELLEKLVQSVTGTCERQALEKSRDNQT